MQTMIDTAQTENPVMDRIRQLLGNKVVQGIVGTMFLKVGSAVVAFALFSLAANAAGAEEFGRFSIMFSVLSILGIVAVAGQEILIVRSWSEYLAAGKWALATGALKYGWITTYLGTALVLIPLGLFFFATDAWTPLSGGSKDWLALAAMAFLATFSLTLYSSHAARATVSIMVGDAHMELTWRALAVIFLIGCLATGHAATTTEILAVCASGLFVTFSSQAYFISRSVHRQIGKVEPEYATKEWTPRSVRLWLATIMEASNQHMEVFLIGLLLDPIAAGAYFVAARLANSFALATGGLYTFGTRRVPSLYFAGDVPALKHTLHLMAGMSLIIVVVGLAAIALAGDYMLMIFGRTYMDYYLVLLILSIGTGLTAANGPAPSFLMFTGHENRYMIIVTCSVLIRVIGFFYFIPTYGIVGAAVVTASVMVGMAFWLNYLCRHLTGMDPSILRFIFTSRDAPPSASGAGKGEHA